MRSSSILQITHQIKFMIWYYRITACSFRMFTWMQFLVDLYNHTKCLYVSTANVTVNPAASGNRNRSRPGSLTDATTLSLKKRHSNKVVTFLIFLSKGIRGAGTFRTRGARGSSSMACRTLPYGTCSMVLASLHRNPCRLNRSLHRTVPAASLSFL